MEREKNEKKLTEPQRTVGNLQTDKHKPNQNPEKRKTGRQKM